MQTDEVIWGVISTTFCSFRTKMETQLFCRNEYNLTGFCSRQACPLANSRYATILEKDGICYLYMKTVERAHSPKNLWERVKLKQNYTAAMEQINEHLAFWPKFTVHKAKQRFTKIYQYLIRVRKLQNKVQKKFVRVHKKVERREKSRERRALEMAVLDKNIEKELLTRLNEQGLYDDILNFSPHFEDLLNKKGQREKEPKIRKSELEEDEEEPQVEQVEEDVYVEDVDDIEDVVEPNDEELESMIKNVMRKRKTKARPLESGNDDSDEEVKPKRRKTKKGKKVEIEFEEEKEPITTNIQW